MRKQILSVLVFQIAALAFSSASAAQAPSSVHAPEGWGQCPRCQNNKDRADSKVKYKVEGHAFNPHDLSGVWGFGGVGDAFTNAPPMTDWGKQQHAKTMGDKNAAGEYLHNKDTSGQGSGSQINCDPKGWPRLHTGNDGFEFVVLPDRVIQFFEQTHTWRTIWTDGRKLPEDPPEPRWMGWNVGRWEGDTFVIESNGYDERSWIDRSLPDGGWTHSDEMKVVERWRRLDYGTLETQITIIDPKTYTQPWAVPAAKIPLVPGTELAEVFCSPSDFGTFNTKVFLPTATAVNKKATEIKVISTGGARAVMTSLVPEFERRSGYKVSIDFGTPGNMQDRLLQGEAADVAIAIAATLPDLEKAGKIASGTRMEFAASYVGVVVRAGAPKLDVSTPDGVKRAMLMAKTVALSDPKAGTQLGATFIGVADRLGFGADLRSRTKMILGPGSDVAAAVARGEADLGVTLISEILPVAGVALGGELPSSIMPPTVMHAFLVSGAKNTETAKAFIDFLRSPEATRIIEAKGMKPGPR